MKYTVLFSFAISMLVLYEALSKEKNENALPPTYSYLGREGKERGRECLLKKSANIGTEMKILYFLITSNTMS